MGAVMIRMLRSAAAEPFRLLAALAKADGKSAVTAAALLTLLADWIEGDA